MEHHLAATGKDSRVSASQIRGEYLDLAGPTNHRLLCDPQIAAQEDMKKWVWQIFLAHFE
jgi:hypothetical protein